MLRRACCGRAAPDLYRFDQSEDLKSAQSPLIARLRSLLYGASFRALLQSITGVEVSGSLDASVSMSCAAYSATHRLLCHDDELQGRRIAYILYLVPDDWAEEDGGQLDLFDSREQQQQSAKQRRPVPIVSASSGRSLLPAFNAFTFFEVTPRSFHAVREVLQSAHASSSGQSPRVRVSVSGWFHGQSVYPPSQPSTPAELAADGELTCLPPLHSAQPAAPLPLSASPSLDALGLSTWLSADYCKAAVCRSVAAHFQAESSVELHNFLQPARYQQLLHALQTLRDEHATDEGDKQRTAGWQRCGPINRRHYSTCAAAFRWSDEQLVKETAERRSLAAALGPPSLTTALAAARLLDDFSLFLRSAVFCSWLQQCTGGLRVSSLRGECRRFACGDYTLALDDDSERELEALDVTLCLFDTQRVRQARQAGSGSSGSSGAVGGRGSKARKRTEAAADWDEEWGGSVHYIAVGAEDELLCSQPAANALTLVYRAGKTADDMQEAADGQQQDGEEEERAEAGGCIRFTEYVTHQCPTPRFDVDLTCRLRDESSQNG